MATETPKNSKFAANKYRNIDIDDVLRLVNEYQVLPSVERTNETQIIKVPKVWDTEARVSEVQVVKASNVLPEGDPKGASQTAPIPPISTDLTSHPEGTEGKDAEELLEPQPSRFKLKLKLTDDMQAVGSSVVAKQTVRNMILPCGNEAYTQHNFVQAFNREITHHSKSVLFLTHTKDLMTLLYDRATEAEGLVETLSGNLKAAKEALDETKGWATEKEEKAMKLDDKVADLKDSLKEEQV
ncbi:hypothetical protein NE237_018824 [Protea cynaroides]|uniref:Uncharacterized protein n=1 Tax=Protea cynaroides TaxID=273540 RepID=A0A9Q0QPD9_9MAGN|nr:hypothetical protein NE237_018824 [Protea cynaroides]